MDFLLRSCTQLDYPGMLICLPRYILVFISVYSVSSVVKQLFLCLLFSTSH